MPRNEGVKLSSSRQVVNAVSASSNANSGFLGKHPSRMTLIPLPGRLALPQAAR